MSFWKLIFQLHLSLHMVAALVNSLTRTSWTNLNQTTHSDVPHSWAMEIVWKLMFDFLSHQVLGDLLRTSDNWYTEQLTYNILLSCSWVIGIRSHTMYYYSVMPFRGICSVRALFHNNEAKERNHSFYLQHIKKKKTVLKISRHFVWNAKYFESFMLF